MTIKALAAMFHSFMFSSILSSVNNRGDSKSNNTVVTYNINIPTLSRTIDENDSPINSGTGSSEGCNSSTYINYLT